LADGAAPGGASGRLGHHAHGRPAVDAQANHHRVADVAADEVAGAVDGVDHPDPRLGEARAVVGHLFGQDGVVGEGRGQTPNDELAGREIGGGDWLALVLVVDPDGRGLKGANQRGRLEGDGAGDFELAGAGHRAAPRSRASARRPASSTTPAKATSIPVTSTGTRSPPIRSEATPMSVGESASPNRWMATV